MPSTRAVDTSCKGDPQLPRETAPLPPAQGGALLERLRRDLRSQRRLIRTPFGERPLVYADYTASGRSLMFLEEQIRRQVLPFYANTHSEASFTGARTGALREAARDAIKRSVGAGPDDRVIFCGSGATAAVNRLIDILGLRRNESADTPVPDAAQRPVVFVGPYEHHSNELPWRETRATVVRIGLDEHGHLDRDHLREALAAHADRPLLIGSFSAASNVTGLRSDVAGITRCLKDAGALALWDYAAAGPYVAIDMNPPGAAIDGLFLSPHKFLGGPGTPGVLVLKQTLLTNAVPAVVGGGTVSYVSPTEHTYVEDAERREEGGTPAIVESIRAGAVFALKDALGVARIEAMEQDLVTRALARLDALSNIEVLGPRSAERLGIFSLRFMHRGQELHHGFVTVLLNDLFGIQARGGCSCAGPYGHTLLNISEPASRALEAAVHEGFGSFKPGWVRINLHYGADPEEIDYLLCAIELLAQHAWRLLPAYRLDVQRGVWVHRDARPAAQPTIADLLDDPGVDGGEESAPNGSFAELLAEGERLLRAGARTDPEVSGASLPAHLEARRWFLTSADLAAAGGAVGSGDQGPGHVPPAPVGERAPAA